MAIHLLDGAEFVEQSAPATPPAGRVAVYAMSDGKIYRKDDTGAESELGGAGGGSSEVTHLTEYDRSGYTMFTNTAAETTICELSIPELSADGESAVLEFFGAVLNSTGVNRQIRMRVYIDGTEVYNDITGNMTSNSSERGVWGRLKVVSNGSVSANSLSGIIGIGGPGNSATGSGDLGTDEIQSWALVTNRNCNQDLTGGSTIRVTGELSIADANLSYHQDHAVVYARLTESVSAGDGNTIKVSSNDLVSGHLNGKLVAGAGVTLTEQNDGGNETLRVDAVSGPYSRQGYSLTSNIGTSEFSFWSLTIPPMTQNGDAVRIKVHGWTRHDTAARTVTLRIKINGITAYADDYNIDSSGLRKNVLFDLVVFHDGSACYPVGVVKMGQQRDDTDTGIHGDISAEEGSLIDQLITGNAGINLSSGGTIECTLQSGATGVTTARDFAMLWDDTI